MNRPISDRKFEKQATKIGRQIAALGRAAYDRNDLHEYHHALNALHAGDCPNAAGCSILLALRCTCGQSDRELAGYSPRHERWCYIAGSGRQ